MQFIRSIWYMQFFLDLEACVTPLNARKLSSRWKLRNIGATCLFDSQRSPYQQTLTSSLMVPIHKFPRSQAGKRSKGWLRDLGFLILVTCSVWTVWQTNSLKYVITPQCFGLRTFWEDHFCGQQKGWNLFALFSLK